MEPYIANNLAYSLIAKIRDVPADNKELIDEYIELIKPLAAIVARAAHTGRTTDG